MELGRSSSLLPVAPCPLQDGASRILRYLRDASFLDPAQSVALDVRLLTYNAALDVMGCARCACLAAACALAQMPANCRPFPPLPSPPLSPSAMCRYFHALIRWQPAGRISIHCWASALPVSSFHPAALRHSAGSRQRLAAVVLLAALVVGRAAVLLRTLLRKLRAQQPQGGAAAGHTEAVRPAAGPLCWLRLQRQPSLHGLLHAAVGDRLLLLDLATAALMLAALVLLAASLAVEQRLEVRPDYSL